MTTKIYAFNPKTLDKLDRSAVYALAYGPTGSAKTSLAVTARYEEDGSDLFILTPEVNGLITVTQHANIVPAKVQYDVVCARAKSGIVEHDPFDEVAQKIRLAMNAGKRTIILDGGSALGAAGVEYFTGGEGDKAMGFDGWGKQFNGWKSVEASAQEAVNRGCNFIYTFWQKDVEWKEKKDGTRYIAERGGPWIQGQGFKWMPGNVDMIIRLYTVETKQLVNGKEVTKSGRAMQFHDSPEYLARTRWDLPPNAELNFGWILDYVAKGPVKPTAKPAPTAVAKK